MFAHRIAERMQGCGTEGAFVVLAEARKLEAEGREIVHLQIGEPDFDTPRNIIDRAHWALDNGWTHYSPSAGILEMRERYAEFVCKQYGVSGISGKNIVIMPGAKPICFLTGLALIDPGDEVILFDPTYPAYDAAIHLTGGIAKRLPLKEETGFRFDHDELAALVSDKTKLFFLNSPQNPTGGVLTREDLEYIAELARRHNFYVFSDEIYNRFVYEGDHASILHVPDFLDHTIMLDGHSKTYAMTGWRLGFSVSSEEMVKHLTVLMTNANSCTSSFTQIAGEEALLGDQSGAEEIIARFKMRRSIIVDGLNSIPGVSCAMPAGAFYAFPNVKEYTIKQDRTSQQLQRLLLHEYGVACLAGTCFGPMGEGYLRFSYANSKENIEKGLERLREAFSRLA
ncbi:pyridoxal phosphate-dependent aminotransferase [bacterium]|nr:pyridoxal phosphate-dependent aminotransferase [bacterium]